MPENSAMFDPGLVSSPDPTEATQGAGFGGTMQPQGAPSSPSDMGTPAPPPGPGMMSPDRKEGIRQLLGNFLYALGQGEMAAGRGGGQAGFGAAVQAPFDLAQQRRQQDVVNQARQQQLQMQQAAQQATQQHQQNLEALTAQRNNIAQERASKTSVPTPEQQELSAFLAANPGKTAADWPAAKAAAVSQKTAHFTPRQVELQDGSTVTANYDPESGTFKQIGSNKDITASVARLSPEKQDSEFQQGLAEYKANNPNSKSPVADYLRSLKPAKDNTSAEQSRADRSYQFNVTEIGKLEKPITDRLTRVQNILDSLNANSPQADALIAPELLTAMAGGQGSGLRMNEAEISRIVGGRNNWETLKSRVNAWRTDPSKPFLLTPDQRQQVRSLVDVVNTRLTNKQQAINDAHQALINTDDPKEHRRIVANLRASMVSGGASPSGNVTVVNPQGQRGSIPASQLDDALKQGYKRAQ